MLKPAERLVNLLDYRIRSGLQWNLMVVVLDRDPANRTLEWLPPIRHGWRMSHLYLIRNGKEAGKTGVWDIQAALHADGKSRHGDQQHHHHGRPVHKRFDALRTRRSLCARFFAFHTFRPEIDGPSLSHLT